MERLDTMMEWLAQTYVNALNIIHYMHDKYCYEAVEMALHDREILRTHGLRHRRACRTPPIACRRSSMRKVKPIRDDTGLIVDYEVEGEFPQVREQRRRRRQHRARCS